MSLRRTRTIGITVVAALVLLVASGASAQPAESPSLPAGWIPNVPTGLVAEPAILKKLANSTDGSLHGDGAAPDGFYAELGHMITGAGWISAGPGYRRSVFGGAAHVDFSAALSWNLYKVLDARIEAPHLAHDRLTIGAQAMYQDLAQVNYFGLGADSSKSDRSAYRFNNVDILGTASVRATSWLSVNGRVGWIPTPDLSTAIGHNISVPNTLDRFTDASAPGLRTLTSFVHGDVSVVADWRDHAGHPTNGGLYRATAASYSDRDTGRQSFRRYEIEGTQFVPVFTPKWVLALHAWEVFSDASAGHIVPFYLMPSLGGQNTLRGYYDYRFHDNDMQLVNVESRWSLFTHVDAAVFAEAGKVAPRAGDLDFSDLKRSYGVGLRVHNSTSTLARLDIGHSTEGWRIFFKISDPFKRTTPAFGRSSVAPFVP